MGGSKSNLSFDEPAGGHDAGEEESPGGKSQHLDLVRQATMSSDKDLLRQLRDAMNPKQRQQTRLMLIQSGVGLIGLGILVGIVIVAQISLTSVDNSVVGMGGTLDEMNAVLTEMNQALMAMNEALEPVQEMEVMAKTLAEMDEELSRLTETLCTSPVFAVSAAQAGCPGGAAPGNGRRRRLQGQTYAAEALEATDPGTQWL